MQKQKPLQQLSIPAPIAKKVPYLAQHHGKTISDDYHWLRDPNYPSVEDADILDYLQAENTYFTEFMTPKEALVDTLFEEFKGRTHSNESMVPWTNNGYEYSASYKQGDEYITYSRRKLDPNIKSDELGDIEFLNVQQLAKPYDYFTLGDWDVSPDNRYVAYSYNTNGDERYTVVVKDLETGELLNDKLIDTSSEILFGPNSQTLVYGKLDSQRWFTTSINVHKLGSTQQSDIALLTETDDSFFMTFDLTSSKEFLILGSGQSEITEVFVLPFNNLLAPPHKLVAREQAFMADVDHANGYFYILANDTHINSRLVRVSDTKPYYDQWETIIAGCEERYFIGMQAFSGFMSVVSRQNGIERLTVYDYVNDYRDVVFPESVFAVTIGNNPQFAQTHIRINYDSMITPSTVFDYSVETKALITKKVQVIPSGYDKSQYVTERIMAPARDNKNLVPVTIVYHKDFKKNATQPMHLYGYGAYGITVTPSFSTTRLSLLDRGFSFAIAHVRGSDMLGHQWYLDGKLAARNNTFTDFIDVAEHLISQQYVAAGNISISGRSAGGELMGAATILAPHLWCSVSLGVPFVDVLNTMLDETLPLTPPEWSEWGNPLADAKAFDLIQAYSPYDNIIPRMYPPMLVTGGLNDPRVTYWEPAKWTAKMRSVKTDNHLLLMRINMGAGHFANSGRYGRLKDDAQEFTFMLSAHGIHQ